ncbi:pyridoxal kinase PdxY [Salinisphaera sp. Q1T1-3]|uniref:pyridoxal kinase PdxY n=1 Tax=Salinisphaera sp. Q1T1-3 TaxID=2321229 RepID=UPI000E7163A1|nr:pyridoxal kinase PdxY [Salinisphaera sp. Q1T1-3]RJS93078.1 pyridoxal kinase PdxY [Salinisphaera sp. Q1T1-3]
MSEILSIQSHVAHGYVGNRAAVFPLQRLGWDVTAINTVQFSNHTGYGAFTGEVFSPAHLADVLAGIESLTGFRDVAALLTGYMGDENTGEVTLDALRRIRAAAPEALYCCDPVMGDTGRGFFVRPGIPEWMRARALPAADIVTPNQFELAWLADQPVTTRAEALAATAALRGTGPAVVLVTSLAVEDTRPERIAMLVDTAEGSWRVSSPRIGFDIAPNGAGDFTAAVFLAGCLDAGLGGDGPARALARTAAAVEALFSATQAAGTRELALIGAQDAVAAAVRAPAGTSIAIERLR